MIYRAIYERDATGVWTVEVANLRGVHTWGRTIEQARSRLRDALALWLDDARAARSAEMSEEFRLPREIQSSVHSARELRQSADRLVEKSQAALREAVRKLIDEQHLSVRDAAEVLGLSFQRVHQIASSSADVVAERPSRYRRRKQRRARHDRRGRS